MFSMSMTIGAMALTRGSPEAAVSQVVHPRFETPFTTKCVTCRPFFRRESTSCCTASMARMAVFVMGKSKGHV